METIFVSALPFKIKEDDLRKLFEPYGEVKSVKIYADWKNPSKEPYAHIEMDNVEKAVQALDGKKIGLTHLRVNKLIKIDRNKDELQRY